MYKVIVADDEPIVLESLRTFPWKDRGCQVVVWVDNGVEALKQAERHKPDIIISDIRMPKMNGLDFSKAVREQMPDTEIILLTGYAEFEYAKEAMSMGIREYLLKPFRFEDVEETLKSCISQLERKRENQKRTRQIEKKLKELSPMLASQVYQDLLEGKISDYSDKLEACNIREAKYVVISSQRDLKENGALDIILYDLIRELVQGMEREFYLARGIDIISCILCFDRKHDDRFCEQAALNFCRMLQKSVFEKLGFGISMGVSMPDSDIYMLHQLKKQSVQALNYRQEFGDSFIMLYSDIQKDIDHGIFNQTIYEKKIQKCVIQNQRSQLEEVYDAMIEELLKAAQGDFGYVKKTLINLVVLTFRFAEGNRGKGKDTYDQIEMLFQCESIEKLCSNSKVLLCSLTIPEPISFGSGIAGRAKEYICSHLQEDISLEQLAQNLNYSTAYLSRLIKKETGSTFSELLQELRIQKAKDLLRKSEVKINSVAVQTGYSDISYFISVFKKKTGVTPNEYRSLSKLEEL